MIVCAYCGFRYADDLPACPSCRMPAVAPPAWLFVNPQRQPGQPIDDSAGLTMSAPPPTPPAASPAAPVMTPSVPPAPVVVPPVTPVPVEQTVRWQPDFGASALDEPLRPPPQPVWLPDPPARTPDPPVRVPDPVVRPSAAPAWPPDPVVPRTPVVPVAPVVPSRPSETPGEVPSLTTPAVPVAPPPASTQPAIRARRAVDPDAVASPPARRSVSPVTTPVASRAAIDWSAVPEIPLPDGIFVPPSPAEPAAAPAVTPEPAGPADDVIGDATGEAERQSRTRETRGLQWTLILGALLIAGLLVAGALILWG